MIIVIGLILGAVFVVSKKESVQTANETVSSVNTPKEHMVVVETPEKHDKSRERSFPGIVNASEESALSFRVGGPLMEVNVKLGQAVKKGDLLMQIDPRDFKDRIRSLEAQLSGVVAIQKKAQQDFARISKLFHEKVLAQSDFDSATSALDATDASVKNLNAGLLIARHALADTSLCAPYDGTLTGQLVENHEMVNPGQVVLKFHNIKLLEINVSLPENEIVSRSLNAGITARVSFPAITGKTCDARLTEWSSSADPLTRTYAVTFEFNAPEEYRVLPGMSADVSWHAASGDSAVLTVPVSALIRQTDGSTFVWVFHESEGRAEQRPVMIGELVGASRIAVTEGLFGVEQVVVSGGRLIDETLALKIVSAR
jgi:RND family efflux transporter MFP subunit